MKNCHDLEKMRLKKEYEGASYGDTKSNNNIDRYKKSPWRSPCALVPKVLSKELPSVVWLWIAPIANFLAAIIAFSLLRLVPFKIVLFQWVEIEDIAIQWILNYDALSATLTCVVCSISALVQHYSQLQYAKSMLADLE
jgi:hypothetical protein